MDQRERLVEQAVGQAKELARTQARLAREQARDALGPALPALRWAGVALGFGVAGTMLLLLPIAARIGRRPVASALLGGTLVGFAAGSAARAVRELPPDVLGRVRDVLRTDLETAARAATDPS